MGFLARVIAAFVIVAIALVRGLTGGLERARTGPSNIPSELRRSVQLGSEQRDLNACGVGAFGCGLVITLGMLAVVTGVMLTLFSGIPPELRVPPAGLANAPAPPLPAEPRLEAASGEDYAQFRSVQDKELNTYGWIDQKTGVVRMPIERAIDLILQRGLPARNPDSTGTFATEGQSLPSDASSGRTMEKVVP